MTKSHFSLGICLPKTIEIPQPKNTCRPNMHTHKQNHVSMEKLLTKLHKPHNRKPIADWNRSINLQMITGLLEKLLTKCTNFANKIRKNPKQNKISSLGSMNRLIPKTKLVFSGQELGFTPVFGEILGPSRSRCSVSKSNRLHVEIFQIYLLIWHISSKFL